MHSNHRAIFLDRDGVLIEDVDLLTQSSQIRILPGVPAALNRLRAAGFRLFVVSNQPVVARGLVTELNVVSLHEELDRQLVEAAGSSIEQYYFCPHHPNATDPAYRRNCDCRKPKPGMLLQAAREHGLQLSSCFMIGDRVTDIIAGQRAGCRTVLVETGQHNAPPIVTSEPIDRNTRPDWTCAGLSEAVAWILQQP